MQPTSLTVRSCDSFDFGGTSLACNPNALEQAATDANLSLAVSLFELAGLSDIFDCAGQFTLLLPVNGTCAVAVDILLTHNQPQSLN